MSLIKLSLKQSVGAFDNPTVKVGDKVKRGQLIAVPNGLGVNLHSSVDGIIKEVTDQYIEITADQKQSSDFVKIPDTASNLEAITEAGVVGCGGAGFPAGAKYARPIPDGHLFINAAECEPVLRHNIARIITDAEKIVRGIEYIKDIVGAKDVQIAIKRKNTNAVALLEEAIRGHDDISLELMLNRYPEGEERAIIRDSNLHKLLKTDELPYAANAIVTNLETVFRAAEAIEDRKPVMTKDITVAGRLNGDNEVIDVKLDVPIGTLVGDILTDYPKMAEYGELILGGPFTGSRTDLTQPISKTAGGVIATIPFPSLKGKKVGLLACACGATPERMKELAASMDAEVVGIEWCKNAVVDEKTGRAKCINPGICPGQAEKILKLRADGAEELMVGNCTDCTNTVMGVAPKLKLPVIHTTDFARRATGMRIMRYMLPENDQ
ncbi:proline reductase-associated electron transfer protein PrdC [Xylocopilactobacillus apicola]|uniref:Proline reductase-associated electron transfer protein PrdC n=1 Tax=Xylocopilactobacillus apicola TaxID=2932184 RepID=A0AAU9D9V8_9LACO|nr:proline reductase-associated electron transfer protein PrdC [Xylocopilactobacillus apicola]BDR57602.1 proline reductase-associated electron transfer protein PrdC [Xylocopilactobacillus apicola]